jgi:hypothetical protein
VDTREEFEGKTALKWCKPNNVSACHLYIGEFIYYISDNIRPYNHCTCTQLPSLFFFTFKFFHDGLQTPLTHLCGGSGRGRSRQKVLSVFALGIFDRVQRRVNAMGDGLLFFFSLVPRPNALIECFLFCFFLSYFLFLVSLALDTCSLTFGSGPSYSKAATHLFQLLFVSYLLSFVCDCKMRRTKEERERRTPPQSKAINSNETDGEFRKRAPSGGSL